MRTEGGNKHNLLIPKVECEEYRTEKGEKTRARTTRQPKADTELDLMHNVKTA